MKFRTFTLASAALVVAMAPCLHAQDSGASLSVRLTPGQAGLDATAVVRGPAAVRFSLFAEVDLAPGRGFCLTVGRFDADGRAAYPFEIPLRLAQAGATLRLQAFHAGTGGSRVATNEAQLDCTALLHERFSFDHWMDTSLVQPGEILTDQWAPMGMQVRAVNFAFGPDAAIVFDSTAPTGGDDDLATPGPGTGNNFGFENLLIVAENVIDMDGDGRIDDPDDERGGGLLAFGWDEPTLVYSVTLVDVDTIDPAGATVRTYLEGVEVESLLVPGLDDNNVQVVYLDIAVRVDELTVEFSGSGAVAEIDFVPCPVRLTFDATTTGVPFGREAGEIIDEQWVSQAVLISGVTEIPTHPDAVVLFDTAHPTGGDDDLVTPGYGAGNDLARGQVLILADDVTDANGDGLVDDPGDSAGGGTFVIDFVTCSTLASATVLDIDVAEPGCFFELFDLRGNSLATFPLQQLGDNSLQTIDFGGIPLVRRLELTLCSSGALVDVIYCPTPGADGGG